MRDIFEDIFRNDPLDPMESARRNMRPALRKRFYQAVSVADSEDGFRVLLDGKPTRTPARRTLAAPTRALAEALAAEWQAQTEVIDPARMPLTRLANSIIDGVTDGADAVAAEIAQYLGSDLLCYRASEPSALVARQAQAFDPVLAWARETFSARFMLAEGVIHVGQPPETIASLRAAIPRDRWRLGAVHAVTTLTGSALLALALEKNALSVEAAWAAAHVDEDFQMEQWGRDELALQRRAFRQAEMQAAAKILLLTAPSL